MIERTPRPHQASEPAAVSRSSGVPVRWNTPFNQVLRSIKKLILGSQSTSICDRTFVLPYEARGRGQQDDSQLLQDLARDASCVLDIGANVGVTSLIMASVMHPDGQLVAFEASEACCLVWRETMLTNGFDVVNQTRIINTLVGEDSQSVLPFDWDFVAGNASAVWAPDSSSKLTFLKSVTSIDRVTEELGLAPNIAKIDVEGAELAVLDGMVQTLEQHRPTLFIEIHSWPGRRLADQSAAVEERLKRFDYSVTDLDGEPLRPNVAGDGDRMSRCWGIAKHE